LKKEFSLETLKVFTCLFALSLFSSSLFAGDTLPYPYGPIHPDFEYEQGDEIEANFIHRMFVTPPIEQSHLVYREASRGGLDPESIKIFVWNIYKARKNNFAEDLYHYANDYDLLMIQEAMTTEMEPFYALDGFRYDFGVSFAFRRNLSEQSGTLLGSKVAPLRTWIARTHDVEPVVRTPKVLTMGTYPIKGSDQSVLLINIHGVNMTNHNAFERHIELSLAQIANHQGPVVFAGDFNTRTKRRLAFMRDRLITQSGFTEVEFRNDERMKSFLTGHILDFVFVRGLDVVDAEVLGHVKSSDHKAMLVELKLPE
jgi:endonuclease/exonuclease/phosphatase (EEP) superfamily protein YafD